MTKQVYFQREKWNTLSIQFKGEIYEFNSMHSLICFCRSQFGLDFDLVEFTDEEWQELYNSGAFDDQ